MNKNKRLLFIFLFISCLLFSCQLVQKNYARPQLNTLFDDQQQQALPEKRSAPQKTHTASKNQYKNLINYGDPNLKRLVSLLNSDTQQTHIIQLGDSHTAADFFSGELRELFQKQYGDAGIGFVPPISIPGQRTANLNRKGSANDWGLYTSRIDSRPDFTLGGYIAYLKKNQGSITLQPYVDLKEAYFVQVLYQSPIQTQMIVRGEKSINVDLLDTHQQWFFSKPVKSHLPVNIDFTGKNTSHIGGWLLVNTQPGVILSSLGINGATIKKVDKWQNAWQQTMELLSPDMVILSYGTNSAIEDQLDMAEYKHNLTNLVREIKAAAPQAVILIVGPSDAVHKKSKKTFKNLSSIIKVQKEVAKNEKTLFWDWQEFMGGEGSMKKWVRKRLARNDYIHFTSEGYKLAAKNLYNQLQHIF